jgi:Tol biopolymer transport system component
MSSPVEIMDDPYEHEQNRLEVTMSQLTKSQEGAQPNDGDSKHAQGAQRPRWKRIGLLLGTGCFASIVCIAAAVAIVYYSGWLSGAPGNRNDMPVWSPDGNSIAFFSDRGGNSDIFIMNPDGSQVRQLTRDPFASLYFTKSSEDRNPSWSPDSSQIAFESGRDNQMLTYVNHDIYVMAADGSNVRRITEDGADEGSPRWSPDGESIAYVKMEYFSDQALIENPTWDIYVMNVDGTQQVQLTKDPSSELEPAWSPDGTRVAFISDRNGRNFDIYVMDADGSNVRQLTDDPANEFGPVWSPDGTQIVFNSDRNGNVQLFMISIDGSNLMQLTKDTSNSAYADWSGDGKRIVFESDRNTGYANIYVMNADGTNIIQLTGK